MCVKPQQMASLTHLKLLDIWCAGLIRWWIPGEEEVRALLQLI